MNQNSIADLSAQTGTLREAMQHMRHYDIDYFGPSEWIFIFIIVFSIVALISCLLTDFYNMHRTHSDPKVVEEIRNAIKLKKERLL